MPSSRKRFESYFERQFGIEKSFWEDFKIHERSDSLWIVSRKVELQEEFMAAGMRAVRKTNRGLKPTTYMLQILESQIDKNIAELDRKQLHHLVFEREVLEGFEKVDKGYVALKFRGSVIGCGLKTGKGLETQIPKSRARELDSCLT